MPELPGCMADGIDTIFADTALLLLRRNLARLRCLQPHLRERQPASTAQTFFELSDVQKAQRAPRHAIRATRFPPVSRKAKPRAIPSPEAVRPCSGGTLLLSVQGRSLLLIIAAAMRALKNSMLAEHATYSTGSARLSKRKQKKSSSWRDTETRSPRRPLPRQRETRSHFIRSKVF